MKKLVTDAPVLGYYEPTEELTLQCDSSIKGLGAVLTQKGQPVAFASRALSDAETRYSQIEKELLAVSSFVNLHDLWSHLTAFIISYVTPIHRSCRGGVKYQQANPTAALVLIAEVNKSLVLISGSAKAFCEGNNLHEQEAH